MSIQLLPSPAESDSLYAATPRGVDTCRGRLGECSASRA
jgi:hypothetical protein